MDSSAVRAIVEREIDDLVEQFGIPHWRIHVVYGPIDGDSNRIGQCASNVHYNKATISLDPAGFDDEAHLLKILRHELFHIVLSPYDLYATIVAAGIDDDSAEAKRLDVSLTHAAERAVINLERMYQGGERRRAAASAAPPPKGKKARK